MWKVSHCEIGGDDLNDLKSQLNIRDLQDIGEPQADHIRTKLKEISPAILTYCGTFYVLVLFESPKRGSPAKSRVYAYNLANLNKKNLMSTTPLSCALNSLILALKDSAAALVDLRS